MRKRLYKDPYYRILNKNGKQLRKLTKLVASIILDEVEEKNYEWSDAHVAINITITNMIHKRMKKGDNK